jgi:hypothetical protein
MKFEEKIVEYDFNVLERRACEFFEAGQFQNANTKRPDNG